MTRLIFRWGPILMSGRLPPPGPLFVGLVLILIYVLIKLVQS